MADLDKLLEKIMGALENLVTLQIVTAVGQVTLKPENNPGDGSFPHIVYDQPMQLMETSIDLLQGDIKTVMSPEFVTGNYQSLRDYHAAREKQGSDIISANLKALRELFNWVHDLSNRTPV